MKKEYKKTEDFIADLFRSSREFNYKGHIYKVLNIGKPRPSKGECKTDIYVLTKCVSNNKEKEFKISVKQNNHEFVENKLSFERAKEVFGNKSSEIIIKNIASIKDKFLEDDLVHFVKKGKSPTKSITIGWVFDLTNEKRGLGEIMHLDNTQKIDVYSGTNLNSNKRDASVNGIKIKDSGIASHILTDDFKSNSLDYYIKKLEKVEEYIENKDIYFACKAVNYRAGDDKYEKYRSLAVFIKWTLVNNILYADFIFDNPLEKKSNEIGENLKDILNKIKIDSNNFNELRDYIAKDIKCFP